MFAKLEKKVGKTCAKHVCKTRAKNAQNLCNPCAQKQSKKCAKLVQTMFAKLDQKVCKTCAKHVCKNRAKSVQNLCAKLAQMSTLRFIS